MASLRTFEVSFDDDTIPKSGWAWAIVRLDFKDEEFGTYPSVRVQVSIPHNDSQSIAEAKKQAQDRASSILQEAATLLREHDVPALRRICEQFHESGQQA